MVSDEIDKTRHFLLDWHGGDQDALDKLLQRDLQWLRAYVRMRLGGKLREELDSMDVVQDVAMDVMRYGPRFVVSDHRQFRALLGKIVENNLRDKTRRMRALKRAHELKEEIPRDSVLDLDTRAGRPTQPDHQAQRAEIRDWVRLALEFLNEEDRRVIELRHFEEKPFEEIGEELGIAKDTARMRLNRALPKLATYIKELRHGKLDTLLE